jgi:radical SAM-linked protein
MMRLRITFSKTSAIQYIGHLDLHRTWERTIRRAQLPLAYSQGFNPRPKINIASALPLGFTSESELIDIWLDEDLPENVVSANLLEAAPPGIGIIKVESIDLQSPKTPNIITSSVYKVRLFDPIPDLAERIKTLLSSKTLIRERRGKQYDLRPLVENIEEILPSPTGEQRIKITLSARPNATGRPDEVLAALEIPVNHANVHRSELLFKSEK